MRDDLTTSGSGYGNGLALLVSADPVTIRQFSHALQELSISHEVGIRFTHQDPTDCGLPLAFAEVG
jgi:hypothetical protein